MPIRKGVCTVQKTLNTLSAVLSELEQLVIVESGLWIAGPQAEQFRAQYARECGMSIPCRMALLRQTCRQLLAELEKLNSREHAIWNARFAVILARHALWQSIVSPTPSRREPRAPDLAAWRRWAEEHRPPAPHLPQAWTIRRPWNRKDAADE